MFSEKKSHGSVTINYTGNNTFSLKSSLPETVGIHSPGIHQELLHTRKYSDTFVSEHLNQDSFCPYLDSRLKGNNTKTVSLIGVFIMNGSTPTRNARNVAVPLNLWAEVR